MSLPDVQSAMRKLAANPDGEPPLPDAGVVWQRAAARARLRQAELATRPIRVAEAALSAMSAAGGLAAALAAGALEPALVRVLVPVLGAVGLATLVLLRELAAED